MPAQESEKKCHSCGGLLTSDKPASFTQWMFLCNCSRQTVPDQDEPSPTSDVCGKCGKNISKGREGSLTQWVFRSDLCDCESPQRISARKLPQIPPQATQPKETETEFYIEVNPDLFPVDRYRPIELLGQGGSSAVYRCRDLQLNKIVAVKTMKLSNPDQIMSFQNEARAVSRLKHRGVIDIFDCGIGPGGKPFIVMEYFSSLSLETFLREAPGGVLPLDTAVYIATAIASTMAYVHKNEIFHKDLKPANILLKLAGPHVEGESNVGEIRLIDFGLAEEVKQSDSGGPSLAGSPLYMSPDQARGKLFTARSEIYSFGCLFFEMLTGNPPIGGKSPLETLALHARGEIPELKDVLPEQSTSHSLQGILSGCLELEPENRFQSFDEVEAALNSWLAESTTSVETVEPPKKRKGGIKIALLCACLCLSLIPVGFMFNSKKQTPQTGVHSAPRTKSTAKIAAKKSNFYRIRKFGRDFLKAEPGVSDADLKKVREVTEANKPIFLDLSNTKVTGESLVDLRGLPIKWLTLSNSKISNKGLMALAELDGLTALQLERVKMDDARIEIISGLPEIKILDLEETNLTDAQLGRVVNRMKNIDDLDIGFNQKLTTSGFAKLRELKNLRILYLNGTRINDEDLLSILDDCPTLKKVEATLCPNLTERGLKVCQQEHARCMIGAEKFESPFSDGELADFMGAE